MGSDYQAEATASAAGLPAEASPELCALVSFEGVATTHVLPAAGAVYIGRSSECDLVIDHPSVSRHHATLELSPLRITDVGSRNGTRLRGMQLAPRVSAQLAPGEAVQLGQVSLLIQHRRLVPEDPPGATQRSSEALLRQLQIECARSARSGSPFAYARIHVLRGDVWYEQLRETLRMTDVVADEGDAFQILLPETAPAQAAGAITRITQLVAHLEAEARIAVARYPFDGTTAEALVARVWEQLESPLPRSATEMDGVRSLIAQVAGSDVSVLITGETGVGKELCAEMVHRQSRRAGRPFVKLNCSTITESLIESELFGHERGAFTGATAATQGLFEAGDGGTVLLDEIGELPLPAQAKLLRVLEERVVRRVGATVGRTLDVRFVFATTRYLPDEIDAGRFRRDLYYRINGVTIAIPPLRERRIEIGALARAFASRPRGNVVSPALAGEVIEVLQQHPWQGNVRELRNSIERAVVLAGSGPIRPEHLVLEASPPSRRSSVPTMPMERISTSEMTVPGLPVDEATLPAAVAEVERKRILDALERCGGNQTRAARMLGISRNTLLARLDSYGLPRPRKS